MNHAADRDTTAHRYLSPLQLAEVVYGADRAFARMAGDPVPREWMDIKPTQRMRWIDTVEQYRRGVPVREVYESRSGEPWSELHRIDQVRLEAGQILVSWLGSVQIG
jgi:hypothetical protein